MTPILFAAFFSATAGAQSVTNGTDVAEGDWEDTAGILYGRSSVPDCTGVLVAPRVVLTAGHCVLHGSTPSAVLLGTNDYRYGGETVDVARTIEYPNSQGTYDAAILVLEEDAQTEPRMIAQDCVIDEDLKDGAAVTIVGYGAINRQGTQYVPQLQEASTTVDDHDCSDMSLGCTRAVSPDGELGAGGEDNVTDSCFGDSGGPLYLNTDKADFLVGLTSRGYGYECGPGGIYVRADALIDWIEDETGVSLPAPDCGNGNNGGGGDTDTDTDTNGNNGGGGNQDDNAAPEPLADDIVVVAGGTATVTIDPNDPDSGDSHTFTVVTAPEHGEATIDGEGVLTFTAGTGYNGADSLTVVVSDDLGASGEVEIGVDIRRRQNNGNSGKDDPVGGCATVSASGALGWLALVGLAARRRRR